MYGKREEPGGLLPLFFPVRVQKVDVFLQQTRTALVMGGNGLSRPGGNFGLRV